MSISKEVREFVRQRARKLCEFCGVSEMDVGGELSIDHFQPLAKKGNDHTDNLIYCCNRCNLYKSDYFPISSKDLPLWNPRNEPFSSHFIESGDGTLSPLTEVGAFTIIKLRLNRVPLIAFRKQQKERLNNIRLLAQYKETIDLLEQLNSQLISLSKDQHQLLKEQQWLLKWILDRSL